MDKTVYNDGSVISDFNLICLGQKEPEKFLQPGVSYNIIDENGAYFNWQRLKRFKGVWYSIYPSIRNEEWPHWYDDEFFGLRYDKKTHICYVVELDKSADAIDNVIRHFLESSKDNALCLLFRLDTIPDHKREFRCTSKDFFEKLKTQKIRFDYIYRLSKGRIYGKRTRNIRSKRKK